jgi:hypothetical protein
MTKNTQAMHRYYQTLGALLGRPSQYDSREQWRVAA